MQLTPDQRHSRLRFDWLVVERMYSNVFRGQAYATTEAMERRVNPITTEADAHRATKYRVDFFVPTLIGPGTFADVTTIGFDLSTGNYPFSEPGTWIISPQVPYSPHFRAGMPVCIGEIWREARGQMLLGQLFVHIAKLLNWDEIARGHGYVGWNRDAIAYHRQRYGKSPINPAIRYPSMPTDLTHSSLFDPASSVLTDLFGPAIGTTERRDDGNFFSPGGTG